MLVHLCRKLSSSQKNGTAADKFAERIRGLYRERSQGDFPNLSGVS